MNMPGFNAEAVLYSAWGRARVIPALTKETGESQTPAECMAECKEKGYTPTYCHHVSYPGAPVGWGGGVSGDLGKTLSAKINI